jgi:alkylhydroperoxidase family enzyme
MLARMETRYGTKMARLRSAVLEGPGELTPEERRSCASEEPPASLRAYVDKVARDPLRVTDADVSTLVAAGHTEDEIFEATVSAALGAGLTRLDRGLAAIEASRR